MLRLFTKNNGAVTVFLVLIMVPVITVATVFVDASRLRMAESIVNSSADLTLETVMAKYDAELSDYYGLLASAQDAEDMVNKANEYLVAAMTSKGLTTAQANSLLSIAVAEYSSYSTGDIVDMLQLSLAGGEDGGEAASVVSPAENGDLTNAAIVKKQISEFMKYRAPVNLVVKIINKFTKAKDGVEIAQQETDLAEKKKTFLETENELLQLAYDIYELTREYKGHFGNDIKKYLEDMETALNDLRDRYGELHVRLVMDLYNSDDVKYFTLPELNDYQEGGTYNDDNKASKSKIKSLASKLSSACDDFSDAIRNLNNAGLTQYKDGMYIVQYWVQVMREDLKNKDKNNVFTEYAKAANKMVSAWGDLKNALNHKEEGVDLDGIDLGCLDSANNLYFRYIKGTGGDVTYFKVGEKMQEGSNKAKESLGILNDELGKIKAEMQSYYDTMQNAKATADKIVGKCDEIIKVAPKYEQDFNSWRDAGNAMDPEKSEMAELDQAEIKAKEEDKVTEKINAEAATGLKTRYQNVSTLLDNIRKDIDEYKYGTEGKIKKIRDIGERKNMKDAFEADSTRIIDLYESTLKSYATGTFPWVYWYPKTPYINTIDENNNPDSINSPQEFEEWIVNQFEEKYNPEEKESGEEQRQAIEEDGENKANEEKTSVVENASDKEIKDQPELPSKGGADTQDAAGEDAIEKADSSISKIKQFFSLTGNIEKLYALDYVMSMFTYDTYLYEGLYNNAKALGYTGDLKTVTDAEKLHTEDYYNKWKAKADESTFTDDKTLTNKVRSMENQFSFGNEVEYILYGGTNSENKTCAYGLIYLIRYAMNTGPMFAAGWKAAPVCDAAAIISGLTQGIIPEPLIKTLIILALIAFESAYDILLLQQGLPVLFVKSKDKLYLDPNLVNKDSGRIEGADDVLVETKEEEDDKEGLNQFFYSDYITLFLFISLSTNEEKTYSRIADVIQVNMAKNTGNDGYRLSKSQVYYKIDAKVEMPAFMMKLPINQDASVWEQMQSSKYQIQYSDIRGY